MKRTGMVISTAAIILLVILISGGFYTVSEWEQVVITQFGRTVGEPKIESGLKFKIPFIQDIHRYEKRIMRWDGDPKEIPTRDKRFIYVDTTARWRIVDPQKFLEVLGTIHNKVNVRMFIVHVQAYRAMYSKVLDWHLGFG